jgi:hypothetical protein
MNRGNDMVKNSVLLSPLSLSLLLLLLCVMSIEEEKNRF